MALKLPDKITVLGTTYKITECETAEHVADKGEDASLGEVWNLREQIRIAKTAFDYHIKFSKKRQTLYHEIFHAIMYELGLQNLIQDELEECLCDVFGKVMDDMLEKNWNEVRRMYK